MTNPLPSTNEAFQSLCRQGSQFPEGWRRVIRINEVSFRTADGERPATLDTFALSGTRRVYTESSPLAARLTRLSQRQPGRAGDVINVIREARSLGMTWGFAGFTLPDRDYLPEAQGMYQLFELLRNTHQLPSLVSDGGVSDGILGLAGVLADHFGVPSLGYCPLQGLASIGPRTHLVIHKDTYQQREVLVALTPDILVCVGGGPGSQRECEEALSNGSVVLLLGLRKYDYPLAVPNIYRSSNTLRRAADGGRLVYCGDIDLLQKQVWQVIRMARQVSLASRTARLSRLAAELT